MSRIEAVPRDVFGAVSSAKVCRFVVRARIHIFVHHRVVMDDDMKFAETSASLMSYPGLEDIPGSPSPCIGPFKFRCGAPEKACRPLADACVEAETRNLLLPHVRCAIDISMMLPRSASCGEQCMYNSLCRFRATVSNLCWGDECQICPAGPR